MVGQRLGVDACEALGLLGGRNGPCKPSTSSSRDPRPPRGGHDKHRLAHRACRPRSAPPRAIVGVVIHHTNLAIHSTPIAYVAYDVVLNASSSAQRAISIRTAQSSVAS
jgi:hypothetical protein